MNNNDTYIDVLHFKRKRERKKKGKIMQECQVHAQYKTAAASAQGFFLYLS
jgi:hypothetical protein